MVVLGESHLGWLIGGSVWVIKNREFFGEGFNDGEEFWVKGIAGVLGVFFDKVVFGLGDVVFKVYLHGGQDK